jgi:hypothetical protein
MTETRPQTFAEQNPFTPEMEQELGATAIQGNGLETEQPVSLGDLARHESEGIYDDFVTYARREKFAAERTLERDRKQNRKIDFELEQRLMMPKIVYGFVRNKSEQFVEKYGEHPILSEVSRTPLPEKMVIANLRQLQDDKTKGRKQNTGAFLAKQEAFEKIATDLKNSYPEVLFAMALRESFEGINDLKYASYAADVVNAAGRTMRILGRLQQGREGNETA